MLKNNEEDETEIAVVDESMFVNVWAEACFDETECYHCVCMLYGFECMC